MLFASFYGSRDCICGFVWAIYGVQRCWCWVVAIVFVIILQSEMRKRSSNSQGSDRSLEVHPPKFQKKFISFDYGRNLECFIAPAAQKIASVPPLRLPAHVRRHHQPKTERPSLHDKSKSPLSQLRVPRTNRGKLTSNNSQTFNNKVLLLEYEGEEQMSQDQPRFHTEFRESPKSEEEDQEVSAVVKSCMRVITQETQHTSNPISARFTPIATPNHSSVNVHTLTKTQVHDQLLNNEVNMDKQKEANKEKPQMTNERQRQFNMEKQMMSMDKQQMMSVQKQMAQMAMGMQFSHQMEYAQHMGQGYSQEGHVYTQQGLGYIQQSQIYLQEGQGYSTEMTQYSQQQMNQQYSQQYHSQMMSMMQVNHNDYYYYTNRAPSVRNRRAISTQQSRAYVIDAGKAQCDGRTTIMVRNIPNKYTQGMLLELFEKNHKKKFDFFYLPIDYNNNCNVGYAFLNFIHCKFIVDFYKEFHGRKWNRFNSVKVCQIWYARIQGTAQLEHHFEHSNVLQQKDKRFRPLIGFKSLADIQELVKKQKDEHSEDSEES